MGEGAACLHGSTAGREGSGGEGARGAPSVLPRPGGMRGRTGGGGGDARQPRPRGCAHTSRPAAPQAEGRPGGTVLTAGPAAEESAPPLRAFSPHALHSPSNTLPGTQRQAPGLLCGRRHARFPHTASPGPLPAEHPLRRAEPSPPRHGPRSGPRGPPPAQGTAGARGAGIPLTHGGTPRSRPAPHRGVSPRRATRVPGLRSAAPRPRGAATAPRGSQPHGQPPRCGIPTHRLRGPCPVHRPQHPCHRGPSPAARCRVPNRPADLSEPQGPQPRGQPLTQGVPAPLLRDPDPTNRSRHPCRGTRPRSPSPCRGVSPQSGAQPHTRPPLPRHGDPTPGTVPRGRDRRPRSTQTPHPAPLHGAATPGPTPRSPHGRTHGGPSAPRGPPAPPALTRACTAH